MDDGRRTTDALLSSAEAERVRKLEEVCLQDLTALAGLDRRAVGRLALRAAVGRRVRRFARDVAAFDRAIPRIGVAGASGELAGHYGGAIVAPGACRVPKDGPLLLVANHPGLYDTLAICATLPRRDLRVLSRPQPLLLLLPEMAKRHLLFVPDSGPDRVPAVRAMLGHLRDGGAALLFPAGHLEPEPTLADTGADPLGEWTPGAGTLIRLAARHDIPLRVVPTALSGALSRRTWRRFRPLIRLRRTPQGRADLIALLQLVFPRLGTTTVRVHYGEPLEAAALVAACADTAGLTERVRDGIYRLLDRTVPPD